MNHPINVSIVDVSGVRSVKATPNPLTTVSPEDTVTWHFDPTVGGNLEVIFVGVRDLPAGQTQPLSNPGPFSSLVPGAGRVDGTIDRSVPQSINQSKRFFYKLFENNIPLPWANPVETGANNGGGIDIPRTPP